MTSDKTIPDISTLPYRPCAGIMMLNAKRDVFVARRIDTRSEAWQMPQGGIDEGEAPQDAAMRELKEEIGTNNVTILQESRDWHNYDLPEHLISVLWGGRFRGQRQKWFAVEFLGDDSEINIETEHPEFLEWRWIEAKKLPEIIVPFKRELYQNVLTEFSSLLPL